VKSDKNVRFAALPCRALRDMKLEGRHLRVLAVVAAHDQLDRNAGAGRRTSALRSWPAAARRA
jgi:hypothetical protein